MSDVLIEEYNKGYHKGVSDSLELIDRDEIAFAIIAGTRRTLYDECEPAKYAEGIYRLADAIIAERKKKLPSEG